MTPPKLTIDFLAEIAHPWSVINLITLERALHALRAEVQAEIQFQPFELAPQLGPEGETIAEGMQRRQQWSRAQAQENEIAAQSRARALGIAFTGNPDRRVWNTFDAHRLMRWAGRQQASRALFLALADAGCNRAVANSRHPCPARSVAGSSAVSTLRSPPASMRTSAASTLPWPSSSASSSRRCRKPAVSSTIDRERSPPS